MSYGLSRAKVDVLVGIDNDTSCRETYEHEKNGIGSTFLGENVMTLEIDQLAEESIFYSLDVVLASTGVRLIQIKRKQLRKKISWSVSESL